jgi:hypothetical protein
MASRGGWACDEQSTARFSVSTRRRHDVAGARKLPVHQAGSLLSRRHHRIGSRGDRGGEVGVPRLSRQRIVSAVCARDQSRSRHLGRDHRSRATESAPRLACRSTPASRLTPRRSSMSMPTTALRRPGAANVDMASPRSAGRSSERPAKLPCRPPPREAGAVPPTPAQTSLWAGGRRPSSFQSRGDGRPV